MSKILNTLVAATCCLPVAAHGMGGDWVVLDMGPSRAESVCVAAATQAFEDFGRIFGIDTVSQGNWTIYGYGLEAANTDAVVTCTYSAGRSARATLVIYSDNRVTAGLIASRYESIFAEQNARLGREWLQRAYDRNGM